MGSLIGGIVANSDNKDGMRRIDREILELEQQQQAEGPKLHFGIDIRRDRKGATLGFTF